MVLDGPWERTRGNLMRIWTSLALAVTIGLTLSGCGTSPDDPPTESTPTPTETPGPTWSTDQQRAIDAVERYFEVWTRISQNRAAGHWSDIKQVAVQPEAGWDIDRWHKWELNDWHLEGSPTLFPVQAHQGVTDDQGTTYHVYMCVSFEDAYVSDGQGNSIEQPRKRDKGISNIEVLLTPDGQGMVASRKTEEEAC